VEQYSGASRKTGIPLRQILRYGIVGAATNFSIYILYLLVTYAGIEPKRAMTVSYLAGASAGFLVNRKWTFSHDSRFTTTFLRYILAHMAGYLLDLSMLAIFSDYLGVPHQLVQAAAIIAVAVFMFAACKYFVFAPRK